MQIKNQYRKISAFYNIYHDNYMLVINHEKRMT